MNVFSSIKQFWSTPRETLTDLGPRLLEPGRCTEHVSVAKPQVSRFIEKLLTRQPQH